MGIATILLYCLIPMIIEESTHTNFSPPFIFNILVIVLRFLVCEISCIHISNHVFCIILPSSATIEMILRALLDFYPK